MKSVCVRVGGGGTKGVEEIFHHCVFCKKVTDNGLRFTAISRYTKYCFFDGSCPHNFLVIHDKLRNKKAAVSKRCIN